MKLIHLILTCVAFSSVGFAQAQKHPRVLELEEKLTKDAMTYLKGRFPSSPFLAIVRVDPLHRSTSETSRGERLPYLDLQETEITDEWDDPSLSMHELLRRTTKVEVKVELPKELSEDRSNEVKENLISLLSLTPARDDIVIIRRDWETTGNYWLQVSFAIGGLLLFLIGLYFILRASTSRIADAVVNMKPSGSGAGSNLAGAAMHNMVDHTSARSGVQDLNFSDPIRIREMTGEIVGALSKDSHFPNFEAMVELDGFCEKDQRAFGALIKEFPIELREKLFSLSYSEKWFEALTNPGDLNQQALSLLLRIHRLEKSTKTNPQWERLLIQAWRLDERRSEFFAKMHETEAFAILRSLPNSIALPIARDVFPGKWGFLLDLESTVERIKEQRIVELIEIAIALKSPRDFSQVTRYRKDRDLLKFLDTAEVHEEKEVYRALRKDSIVHQLRPPFFKVLEEQTAEIGEFVANVPVSDWAMALFNVSKAERKNVEAIFNEKQRLFFVENLKSFDGVPPNKDLVGKKRASIAKFFKDWKEILDKTKGEVQNDDKSTETLAA
ncbi:MAG: hypothetical protein COT74_04900 [Bdellovibrionales bacterium CG10_big_fil_rev_8_21_14_0_10_45_34]|nr:MAG: hypothetical protein COT74_04900 [Bdellovibrionales bacterium CG10_big_fil_rev_8_21_14_0_10_45_34]